MRTKTLNYILIAVLCLTCFVGCKKKPNQPPPNNYERYDDLTAANSFKFNTFQKTAFNVNVRDWADQGMSDVRITLFNDEPNPSLTPFLTVVTNNAGVWQDTIALPSHINEMWFQADIIGTANLKQVSLSQNAFNVNFGGAIQRVANDSKGNNKITNELEHFPIPKNTGVNMSVILRQIHGISLPDHAEVACITPNNVVAGAEVITNGESAGIAVWGNDTTTDEIDGFRTGDPLRFLYWDRIRGEVATNIILITGTDTTFTINGFIQIDLFAMVDDGYDYIGEFDQNGRPNNLIQPLELSLPTQRELSRLLINGGNLPLSVPNLFEEVGLNHIVLDQASEVSVSVVHNRTENPVSVGYFLYDPNESPTFPSDIERHRIIFPNATLRENNGFLSVGDRVALGQLPSGVAVGFFIVPNGWNGEEVVWATEKIYTLPALNLENNPNLKRHQIFVRDNNSNNIYICFEGDRRDTPGFGNNDFNDIIIAVSVEQNTVRDFDDIHILSTLSHIDMDNDGVPDVLDRYPNDNNRAYTYAQRGIFASNVSWPGVGNRDFNDLVVSLSLNLHYNYFGMVAGFDMSAEIYAVGSTTNTGFGIGFPVPPNEVSVVTGVQPEAGQSKATFVLFDNWGSLIVPPFGFQYVNTETRSPLVNHQPIALSVNFNQPISLSVITLGELNPFTFYTEQRGREIHLPDFAPTDLADMSLFRRENDRSIVEQGIYYRNANGLAWAIMLPQLWRHPLESVDIVEAYPNMATWVMSSGIQNRDWYIERGGNVILDKIYRGR